MKVKLKKIKVAEYLSQETTAFAADLYIDGEMVGYCQNDGHGGSTSYSGNNTENIAIIKKAELWAASLPAQKFSWGEIKSSLEGVIDDLLTAHLIVKDREKFNKKLQKSMLTGIVFGTDNEYSVITWKGFTIEKLLNTPKGVEAIKKAINEKIKNQSENIKLLSKLKN